MEEKRLIKPLESKQLNSLVKFSLDSEPVGVGFFVAHDKFVTCAHNVKGILGLGDDVLEPPQVSIPIAFPLINCAIKPIAHVISWSLKDDIALLKLDNTPPDNIYLPEIINVSANMEYLHGIKVYFFGYPLGAVQGTWGDAEIKGIQEKGWFQMEDYRSGGYEVQKGFSGSPIWHCETWKIMGMIIAADLDHEANRVGYALPSNTIAAFCEPHLTHEENAALFSVLDPQERKVYPDLYFLSYFPDGILRTVFDYLVSRRGYNLSSNRLKNAEKHIIRFSQDGMSFIKLDPELSIEMRIISSEFAGATPRALDILLDFCDSSDIFYSVDEFGIGRARLIRDLCRLAVKSKGASPATDKKIEKADSLARKYLPIILEEGNTQLSLEINETLMDISSFSPQDYLFHADILMRSGRSGEAFSLVDLYIGDNFFEGAGLTNTQRISAIVTWAKSAKDSGRAGDMHDRLLLGYKKAMELLPELLKEQNDDHFVDSLKADLLNNRATQLAVFGSAATAWRQAKADIEEAIRISLAHEDFVDYVNAIANLVALSLDRKTTVKQLNTLDKRMSAAEKHLSGMKKIPLHFFFYYQWGRLAKQQGVAKQATAKAYFQSARDIAKEIGLGAMAAISDYQLLSLAYEREGVPYDAYLNGLNQCISVLEANQNTTWAVNTLYKIFFNIASIYLEKGENRLAWEASLGAFRILHQKAYTSGVAISPKKAIPLLKIMEQSRVDEAKYSQFTAQYRDSLNRMIGSPISRQHIAWNDLMSKLKIRS